MTYLLLSLGFVGVAAIAGILLRPRDRVQRQAAVVGLAAVLVLTAVFDNVMIIGGLVDYSSEHIAGWRLGVVPVEDFAYPLAGALALPALWWALRRRRARPPEPTSAMAAEGEAA